MTDYTNAEVSAKAEQPVRRTITLTMDEDVAETLRAVCHYIGGDMRYSRRAHIDRIGDALDHLGVRIINVKRRTDASCIYFKRDDE